MNRTQPKAYPNGGEGAFSSEKLHFSNPFHSSGWRILSWQYRVKLPPSLRRHRRFRRKTNGRKCGKLLNSFSVRDSQFPHSEPALSLFAFPFFSPRSFCLLRVSTQTTVSFPFFCFTVGAQFFKFDLSYPRASPCLTTRHPPFQEQWGILFDFKFRSISASGRRLNEYITFSGSQDKFGRKAKFSLSKRLFKQRKIKEKD